MSARLTPCSRTEFVRKLRALGYAGPFPGGNHAFMVSQRRAPVRVPNPHRGDIDVGLLRRILGVAGIDVATWLAA